jgi:hypothetical protein
MFGNAFGFCQKKTKRPQLDFKPSTHDFPISKSVLSCSPSIEYD